MKVSGKRVYVSGVRLVGLLNSSQDKKLSKSLIGHGDRYLGKTFDRKKADAKAAQHALL